MLDAVNHQGKFGEDYVRVLASAAGLVVYKEDIDHDGVDLGIKLPNAARGWSKAIEVQVKTTSVPSWKGGRLVFTGLSQSQFNKLAGPLFTVPRFLFVVIVPRSATEYAEPFTAGMLLRNLGYFMSLQDREPYPRPDGDRRARLELPAANVLTAAALRRLVDPGPMAPR